MGNIVSESSRDIIANKERNVVNEYSQPVMKKDFDVFAENMEHRFNQLQIDLMKEKQHCSEVNKGHLSRELINGVNEDIASLSSISSMESLPFILGPPADFKDTQNTLSSQTARPLASSLSNESDIDMISGFLEEGKSTGNLTSNEALEKQEKKIKPNEAKTFKVRIKIDRAVNMKAIKGPCNGKKGKIPPSTWVSFGVDDCCKQNCGVNEIANSGVRYNTCVVRKNYNPVWNSSWDVDLPIEFLSQVSLRIQRSFLFFNMHKSLLFLLLYIMFTKTILEEQKTVYVLGIIICLLSFKLLHCDTM